MSENREAVVFLDFDGVLHPRHPVSSAQMFAGLLHLDTALRDLARIGIVITSTWRNYPRDLAYALDRFPGHLRQRVLGSTPLLGGKGKREEEILGWLHGRKCERFRVLILDDEPELFENLRDCVLAINGEFGLTEADARCVREWLVAPSVHRPGLNSGAGG